MGRHKRHQGHGSKKGQLHFQKKQNKRAVRLLVQKRMEWDRPEKEKLYCGRRREQ
jgi:hypothetical protein